MSEQTACTCDEHTYDEHTCPFAEDVLSSSEVCNCCPYCENNCADSI